MRVHYIPNRAFSYPSDRRRPSMRMFFPSGNVPVCGRGSFEASDTDKPDDVTCATCRKRMAIGRFDSPGVIDEVLSRGRPHPKCDTCGKPADERWRDVSSGTVVATLCKSCLPGALEQERSQRRRLGLPSSPRQTEKK